MHMTTDIPPDAVVFEDTDSILLSSGREHAVISKVHVIGETIEATCSEVAFLALFLADEIVTASV